MKKILPLKTLPVNPVRFFVAALVTLLLISAMYVGAIANIKRAGALSAPAISYSSPHTYVVGTAIAPLVPTSSGVGAFGTFNGQQMLTASVNQPRGMAVDNNGNLYVADFGNSAVKKIPADGSVVTTIATGFQPSAVAVGSDFTVYVCDYTHNQVVKMKADGTGSTVIPTVFNGPLGIAVDASGNIYVADTGNKTIVEMTFTGHVLRTLTGYSRPTGVAVDFAGNVYVADFGNNAIGKVPVGSSSVQLFAYGITTPYGVAVDNYGDVYYSDNSGDGIKMVAANGTTYHVNNDATHLGGLAVNNTGKVYTVADFISKIIEIVPAGGYYINKQLPPGLTLNSGNGTISGTPLTSLINSTYTITAYNGSGSAQATTTIQTDLPPPPVVSYTTPQVLRVGQAFSLMPASTGVKPFGFGTPVNFSTGATSLVTPVGLVIDRNARSMYVCDAGLPYLLRISNIGGNPTTFGSGLSRPSGCALDASGNVYVADYNHQLVQEFDISGNLVKYFTAQLAGPIGVAVDAQGYIFVADSVNRNVKKISPIDGSFTVVAVSLNPSGIVLDAAGTLYITDKLGNHVYRLRKGETAASIISSGYKKPAGITVDAAGNVYVADNGDNTIKMLGANDNDAPVVVKTGLNSPYGMTTDSLGNIFTTELTGHLIKKLTPSGGYFISDPLPAGLTLNRSTGIISGTPTTITPAQYRFVTAYNNYNFVTAYINLQVRLYAAATIHYTSPQTYKAGVAISPLTPVSTDVNGPGYGTPSVFLQGFTPAGGLAVDAAGNIYYGDQSSHSIKLYQPQVSGLSTIQSGLSKPTLIAVDSASNVFVYDDAVKLLTRRDHANTITQVYSGVTISGLAVDNAGTAYFTDAAAGQVLKVLLGTTIAVPVTAPHAIGSAGALGVDAVGNVYVMDFSKSAIMKIAINGGWITTFASSLPGASGLAVDNAGNVYEADNTTGVRKITQAAQLTTLGTGWGALANIAIDGAGNLYVGDKTANAVKIMAPNGGYFISPRLPKGLNFDTTTGTISGAPANGSPATNYAVTGWNAGGSTATTVNIKISSPSSIATLSNLTASAGILSPVFTSGATVYQAAIPNTTTAIKVTPTATDGTAAIKVNDVVVASGVASASLPLTVGSNTITIVVTAADATTTKTYTLMVTRAAANLSANAVLSVIKATPASSLTVVTGADYKNYTTTVPATEASVTITPTAQDATATIKVNGITVASGTASASIPLNVGTNVIKTVVTAQDGATVKTYGITFTRPASANASLSGFALSSGTLSPVFAAATASYTATVANATASITVTPTVGEAGETVKVNGVTVASATASGAIALTVGPNVITTVVTASNGTTTKTYTLTVTRGVSNNAVLTIFKLTPATTLTTVTGNDYRDYTTTAPNSETTVKITPTAQEATATITVNGVTVASGTASASIPLIVGDNVINTVVTAQDGVTKKTYSVKVSRAPSVMLKAYQASDTLKAANDGVTVHPGLSPNGDGISDVLIIDGITNYPDNTFQVINRSGALVYSVKGYDNVSKAFDGTSNINGKLQQPGTYFYRLEYTFDGKAKFKTGFIVIKY